MVRRVVYEEACWPGVSLRQTAHSCPAARRRRTPPERTRPTSVACCGLGAPAKRVRPDWRGLRACEIGNLIVRSRRATGPDRRTNEPIKRCALLLHPIREAGARLASGETAEGTASKLRPHSIIRWSELSAGPDLKFAHEASRVSADQELKHHSSPYPRRRGPGAGSDSASDEHSGRR